MDRAEVDAIDVSILEFFEVDEVAGCSTGASSATFSLWEPCVACDPVILPPVALFCSILANGVERGGTGTEVAVWSRAVPVMLVLVDAVASGNVVAGAGGGPSGGLVVPAAGSGTFHVL